MARKVKNLDVSDEKSFCMRILKKSLDRNIVFMHFKDARLAEIQSESFVSAEGFLLRVQIASFVSPGTLIVPNIDDLNSGSSVKYNAF